MQTSAAEMLGVRFPICTFSHYRDALVAVTDEDGVGAAVRSSERNRAQLPDKCPSETSHDSSVARMQISVSSGRQRCSNYIAVQNDSKFRSTNNEQSTATAELEMAAEFIDAGGLLNNGGDQ
jgi:hypothetical protein